MNLHSTSRVSALAFSAAALLSATVSAGDAYVAKPRAKAGAASENNFPGLTGDWGGLRSSLKDAGYEFNASYTGEWFGNPKGGDKRGNVYNGLLKLTIDVNLEKTFGWSEATFRISSLYPHGTSGSWYLGDRSIYSNIDAYDTFRLMDLWVEQKAAEGKLSLKVGQMRVDDEFGVTDTASLFINSTFGAPNPPATNMPLAVYPVGALGARLRAEPLEGLYGQIGLYDGNPSPGDAAGRFRGNAERHGTDFALRHSDGALLATELGYQHNSGDYPGAVRFGSLFHSATFDDVRAGHSETHGNSNTFYAVVDQMIWPKTSGSKEGLSGFLRTTSGASNTNIMNRTYQGGLVYTGILSAEDKLGAAYTRNKFSPGQTLDGTVGGSPLDREAITELSYQYPVSSYLRIQPDLQYISHPGGTRDWNNAWVIGVRAILDF